MKKFFRVAIPIIMVLAILICLGWYLFSYDREFTRDMFLYGARYFDERGNLAVSSWFYDRAYDQVGDNDDVAIELANQHKADGNYTQAEATLSKAIEDGGGIKLYIALCKTYAEQDKLIDCVSLLNSVTNPEIKAQLDEMRPAAPVATPDAGFYNQYISVTLTSDSGTVYVNTEGEYPSINDDVYTAPVPLKAGENTLYALAVDDNGLVSQLAIFGYTINGVIEEVRFADEAFEDEIRNILNVGSSQVLYSNELWGITEFVVPEDARSYEDLKYLPFLEKLTIIDGPKESLAVLSALAKLTHITITDTTVSAEDFAVIGMLPKLEELTLSGCGLSTTAGLENATELVYLDLSNNTIRNISSLSSLRNLKEVYLQNNALSDLSSLSSIKTITRLNVSGNALTTITPICNITSLVWLDASNNQLNTLEQVGNLTKLQELYLSKNLLTNLEDIHRCSALKILYVDNNQLTDIHQIGTLSGIILLDFSSNQVTALPEFQKDCALVEIYGSSNLLENLDALGGLPHLNRVFMDYNENIESVEPLASCPVLIRVDVYGTKVTEVDVLTDHSIVVNYNPVQEEDK